MALCAQDLDYNSTLTYINEKLKAVPYEAKVPNENDPIAIYNCLVALTSKGELEIERKEVSYESNTTIEITTFRIPIDKIDINKTFNSDDEDHVIRIFPFEDGFFNEDTRNFKDNTNSKKIVNPIEGFNASGRQHIPILVGDFTKTKNIKNALFHLCELVLKDPKKYGLLKEVDPFENNSEANKVTQVQDTISDVIRLENSNIIKIEKNANGLIEVPVILNDVIKIKFIFDSGASEVSLSPDVALTLMRTGSIQNNDWLPSQTYTFADGSTAKSKRFIIRKLIIGNQILLNIEASIASSIDAPMLLGQNVMKKLGSITIDYKKNLLIINQ
jgi:aspartyl protease family protein